MGNEAGLPTWIAVVVAIFGALGVREILAILFKGWSEERKAKKLKELEKSENGDKVLLDTIEDMRKDIERQKTVEVELREKLSDERADKVKYRTKLEMILDELEKQVDS